MTPTAVETERDPSLTQLVTGIISDTEELLKQQLKLVKVEVQNDVRGYITAVIPMIIGGSGLMIASIVLAFAGVYGLAAAIPALPLWGACLVVGLALSLLCGGFIAYAIQKFSSVKETIQWKTKS
jgi:hypothetical protein